MNAQAPAMEEMFDRRTRMLRRDRAARAGGDLFLLERAFDDCVERIAAIGRRFDRALLIGCPDPGWRSTIEDLADIVDVVDPGTLFARTSEGSIWDEGSPVPGTRDYALIVAVGTLDTANQLQAVLRQLHDRLVADGLFIGALSGGETLPLLRQSMASADRGSGRASPHVHPRIEAAMLAPLLEHAGFVRPVVDVDRVQVAYSSFDRLIGDLRAMAATNILSERSRTPLTRSALEQARATFAGLARADGRSEETFEILHFAAWR